MKKISFFILLSLLTLNSAEAGHVKSLNIGAAPDTPKVKKLTPCYFGRVKIHNVDVDLESAGFSTLTMSYPEDYFMGPVWRNIPIPLPSPGLTTLTEIEDRTYQAVSIFKERENYSIPCIDTDIGKSIENMRKFTLTKDDTMAFSLISDPVPRCVFVNESQFQE